jgi:putative endonuclease
MLPISWARRIADRLRGLSARPRGARGAGWDWERAAERELVALGYRILERNYAAGPRDAEIDLVAEENGVVCFVEVKGRSSTAFGSPALAVTAEKQRRVARAARSWLARRRTPTPPCRFDVVCVTAVDGRVDVEIIRDAFRLTNGS